MLILGVNIGAERYGIEAVRVLEVVPLITLKKVPMAEQSIRGLFDYHGNPTPVVDLCHLFEQRNCEANLSTRIIIIMYTTNSGESRPVGLIAEKVTDVVNCETSEITDSGIHKEQQNFLGRIYKHNNEMIQLIDINKVLPKSISNQLMNQMP